MFKSLNLGNVTCQLYLTELGKIIFLFLALREFSSMVRHFLKQNSSGIINRRFIK